MVIDEYPYLAASYAPISSIIQKHIDECWKDSNLFLISPFSATDGHRKRLFSHGTMRGNTERCQTKSLEVVEMADVALRMKEGKLLVE